jgi:hypothetical protein
MLKTLTAAILVLLSAAGARAQECQCQCFDGRPLPICPEPQQKPPICLPEACTPPKPAYTPPPPPKVEVCSNEQVYNEIKKEFETKRVCK